MDHARARAHTHTALNSLFSLTELVGWLPGAMIAMEARPGTKRPRTSPCLRFILNKTSLDLLTQASGPAAGSNDSDGSKSRAQRDQHPHTLSQFCLTAVPIVQAADDVWQNGLGHLCVSERGKSADGVISEHTQSVLLGCSANCIGSR